MVEAFKNENIDHLLKRFRVECEKFGIVTELKKREYYISPSKKRHIQKCEIRRKNKLRRKQFKERGY